MRKLALSAEDEVIRSLPRGLLRMNRTSVSAMFERFIRFMSRRSDRRAEAPGSLTLKAGGVAALPKGKNDRALVEDALMENYEVSVYARADTCV